MLKFISIDGQMPPKRVADERRHDFFEIYGEYIQKKAKQQASRCSQCGIPFCQSGCPLQNNIPDWLNLAAEGHFEQAYQVSAQTNPMPEICGRICPQDRLCEGACVIEKSGHGSVTIGAIERMLTDNAWEKGWVKPLASRGEKPLSVGIIGSGPAGLAAAEALCEQGWQVSVYERHDRAGGLLMYGIPNFKLDKSIVVRRIKRLEDGGVKFILNTDIGNDIGFNELRQKHATILVATGVYKARRLSVQGAGLMGVIEALPYLINANRVGLGDTVKGISAKGKDVVVIGGGDTAMDCVRTALRQEAKSVTCLYRRDERNMPGSIRETNNAKEEGVHFEWLAAPNSIHDVKVEVKFVRADRMRLGARDRSGRQSVSVIEGASFDTKADLVIQALGFTPENMKLFSQDLALTNWGTIQADPLRFSTNIEGVYAAGDIVRGASLVVWAIAEGRAAASAINTYLSAQISAAAE
ncbi:MAG: NAD(P)-dependent oxidoreductase [Robiginitomaculum sp.]